MTFEKTLIRPVVLLGAFALCTFTVTARLEAQQTPSPALLITIQGPGERALAIADPLTRKVVGSVPMGGNPHDVAASADGKLAFVTINNGGWMPGRSQEEVNAPGNEYISVIDLAAQKELRRVETGPGSFPHGIVFAGGKVYFTAEGYKLVGRFDPASNRIDRMIGTGQNHSHVLVVSKDAKQIFTANTGSDTVTAAMEQRAAEYDTAHDLWNATAIPVGKGPEGIAMSPDGKEVWASTRDDGGVSIIDVATKKVSQTLDLKLKTPIRLQVTPDGKRVIIPDNFSGEVLVLDAVTRKEIKRISLGKTEEVQVVKRPGMLHGIAMKNGVRIEPKNKIQNLLIAPDGSHVYLTVSGSNRIAIIDLKTLEVTGSISVGREPEGLGWAERK